MSSSPTIYNIDEETQILQFHSLPEIIQHLSGKAIPKIRTSNILCKCHFNALSAWHEHFPLCGFTKAQPHRSLPGMGRKGDNSHLWLSGEKLPAPFVTVDQPK